MRTFGAEIFTASHKHPHGELPGLYNQ